MISRHPSNLQKKKKNQTILYLEKINAIDAFFFFLFFKKRMDRNAGSGTYKNMISTRGRPFFGLYNSCWL
jgi:hypothetical protein